MRTQIFKKGHAQSNTGRTHFKKGQPAHLHPRWKGGRRIKKGYVVFYMPNHPHCFDNVVLEHRLVVEREIGRYLTPEEEVHHLDENKINNVPNNLIAFTSHSAHIRFHGNPGNVTPEEIIFDGRKLYHVEPSAGELT